MQGEFFFFIKGRSEGVHDAGETPNNNYVSHVNKRDLKGGGGLH